MRISVCSSDVCASDLLQAVCSGFVSAMATADMYIRGGMARRVLVIGAETFSRILDWKDRTTCVLFGDGAGALILEAAEGEGTVADRGILTAHLRSDGAHRQKLYVDGGPSTTGTVGHLRMEGREVRSEERRVGKEGVSTGRTGGSPEK